MKMLFLDNNGKIHIDLECAKAGRSMLRIMIDLPVAFVLTNRCNACGTAEEFETEVKARPRYRRRKGEVKMSKGWATRWNEIMRYGKEIEEFKQWPTLTDEQIRFVVYECEQIAYRVLSDSTISKVTSGMSEEGREIVASTIAKMLSVELQAVRGDGENVT
jgi:hypothetical protein